MQLNLQICNLMRAWGSKESAEGQIKEHILYSLLLKHHPHLTWWKHFLYLARWADAGQSSEVWCSSPLLIHFNTTIFRPQSVLHTPLSCHSVFISWCGGLLPPGGLISSASGLEPEAAGSFRFSQKLLDMLLSTSSPSSGFSGFLLRCNQSLHSSSRRLTRVNAGWCWTHVDHLQRLLLLLSAMEAVT